MAAHEGGALGFLSDKAREIMGEVNEAADAAEKGKDFWEKAKDFVAEKADQVKQAVRPEDAAPPEKEA